MLPLSRRAGVFKTGNIQIGPLFSSHPDGMILAGLAATDEAGVFFFDPAAFHMPGTEDRMFDNFMAFGGIIGVVKFDTGGNLVGSGYIKSGSRTFDHHLVGVLGKDRNRFIQDIVE